MSMKDTRASFSGVPVPRVPLRSSLLRHPMRSVFRRSGENVPRTVKAPAPAHQNRSLVNQAGSTPSVIGSRYPIERPHSNHVSGKFRKLCVDKLRGEIK